MIDKNNTIIDNQEMQETLAHYRLSFGIKRDDPRGHNRLGVTLTNQGKLAEATTAFLRAISLDSGYAQAYHNLGNALAAQKKDTKALAAYEKAKKLDPGNETAHHLADALAGRQPPAPPRKFVRKLFDQYASFFDRHLGALTYQAPENLKAVLLNHCSVDLPFDNAVDLGCGTGLSGLAFAELSKQLHGIDISANMLEKAAQKQVYDDLTTGDICQVLQGRQQRYALFIAVDVLAYVGRLDELFRTVRDKAGYPGLFLFTTETCHDHDFLLLKSGRYAHSPSYIDTLCQRYGFTISCREETPLRTDNGRMIVGDAYVLEYG